MKVVLIVVWLATSQSYSRQTVHWMEVALQEFDSVAACEKAAQFIQDSCNATSVQ